MDISILHLNDLTTAEVNKINAIKSYIATRKLKNLGQQEIAEIIGTDYKAISAFERRYDLKSDAEMESAYKLAIEQLLAQKKG